MLVLLLPLLFLDDVELELLVEDDRVRSVTGSA